LDGQVTRAELERVWADVRQQLDTAARLLPSQPRKTDEGGSIDSYRGWLEHNELELALDELELLGEANRVPRDYWIALATACRLMGLEAREARCRSRISRLMP
jgi:hypothetical protein